MAHSLTSPRSLSLSSKSLVVDRSGIFVVLLCLLGGYSVLLIGNSTNLGGGARGLDGGAPLRPFVHSPVCHDFFTVLSDAWVKSESNCTTVYDKYKELLEEHDEHMKVMGTSLTVFTTWSQEELQDDKCVHYYDYLTNIKFQQFDPEQLLLKHGFSEQQINWMQHWQDTAPRFHHTITRLSDVFRIVLAKEHQMAYADLDLVYLMDDKRVYLDIPNVVVPVWKEEQGALEIQNSAFCFNPAQLDVLLDNVKALMNWAGDEQLTKNKFIYTAFGPNLFQHSIQKMSVMGPLQLYYTHSDDHWKVEDVRHLHRKYGKFVWLHLDSSNRRRNWYRNKSQTYRQLVAKLKEECPPPDITEVLPKYVLESGANNLANKA